MLKSLISVRLRALLGGVRRGKDGKVAGKGRIALIGIAYLYVALVFGFLSFSIASVLAPITIILDSGWMYFSVFNTAAFTIVFIFSVFETKSQLFECKDNELLMSMPIPPRLIMYSRLISVLILNFAEAAVIILPAIVVYAVHGGGILALVGSIVMGILTPLLATALSVAVGYLVALISSRLKKNSFVTLGITIAFLAVYFVLYDRLMNGINALSGDNSAAELEKLGASLTLLRWIGEASLLLPVPFLLFLGITAGTVVLLCFVLGHKYFDVINMSAVKEKKEFKAVSIKTGSVFGAMARKELSRFFSSATYMLNGGIGVIFGIILSVLLLVNGKTLTSGAEMLFVSFGVSIDELLPPLAIAMLIALSSTVGISASALSLEGKSFWIIRTAPIRTLDIIHAKLVPHLAVSLPSTLVSSVIFAIAIRCQAIYLPFVIIAPLMSCFLFAFFGLIINISLPKLEFENEAQVVKQSGASFVATFSAMIFGVIIVFGSFFLTMLLGGFVTSLILTVLIILLALTLYLILIGPSQRRLTKI